MGVIKKVSCALATVIIILNITTTSLASNEDVIRDNLYTQSAEKQIIISLCNNSLEQVEKMLNSGAIAYKFESMFKAYSLEFDKLNENKSLIKNHQWRPVFKLYFK